MEPGLYGVLVGRGSEAGQIGAWFTGHNELPERTWETRSKITAADRGREFSWIVGGSFARWSFTFDPDGKGTKLTESWQFLLTGIGMFQEKYADRAAAEIDARAPGRLTTGFLGPHVGSQRRPGPAPRAGPSCRAGPLLPAPAYLDPVSRKR